MWADALQLLQSGERLQRQFFVVGRLQTLPCWEPQVDLYEQGDELRLLVALPGVARERLQVVLEESATEVTIVVRGERPIPSELQAAAIHRLEIPYGRFERRVALPAGNFQLLEQLLQNGCLALVLRRLS